MSSDEAPSNLQAWIDALTMASCLLEDFLPDDVVLDHSPESLDVFGQVVASGAYSDHVEHIEDALAAYFGQTLRRAAGGRWSWDKVRNRPLLYADEALDLDPVSPVNLIRTADDAGFAAPYETWDRAARAYADQNPGWAPQSEHTPGLDAVPPAMSDTDQMNEWLATQERAFPEWVRRYGGGTVWDFSVDSIETLAHTVFHVGPNPAFLDGAAWYCGETFRRNAPSRWEYVSYFEEYGVTRNSDDWSVYPRTRLAGLFQDGHPLTLIGHFRDWTGEPADSPEEWTWSGTEWQDSLHRWRASIAGHIASLLPLGIELDMSLESVRRLDEIAPGPQFDNGLAAYLGETLLRTAGGRWHWYSQPIACSAFTEIADVPLLDLIRLARKWRDSRTFSRVYEAWQEAARSSTPVRQPTPGLDPAPAPTDLEKWMTQGEESFPRWVSEYGVGPTWDFSYESLKELGEIVLATTPTCDQLVHPANRFFTAGAVWYFGESLHRSKPGKWSFQPSGQGAYDTPLRGLQIQKLDAEAYYPVGICLLQDMELMLDHSNPGALAWVYGNWVVARRAARAKVAFARRSRKKSRRKQPDEEYLVQWLTTREREFSTWVERFGSDSDWDFTPGSIDALETLILDVDPEGLSETFLDGAIWYYGETFRRTSETPFGWTYNREISRDPYLRSPQPIEPITEFEIVYQCYERGVLRHRLEGYPQ